MFFLSHTMSWESQREKWLLNRNYAGFYLMNVILRYIFDHFSLILLLLSLSLDSFIFFLNGRVKITSCESFYHFLISYIIQFCYEKLMKKKTLQTQVVVLYTNKLLPTVLAMGYIPIRSDINWNCEIYVYSSDLRKK